MNYCKKHFPKKPVIISNKYPCKCQGLCLLKEFCKKNKEKCRTTDADKNKQKKKEFLTGSYYEGDWTRAGGMHGHGVYTFPNGVVYEGEFVDGAMHGKGELRYQTNIGLVILRGQWTDGIMTERKIFFDDDTLEYDGHDWQYCKIPDRRYSGEYTEGIQPGGISNLTAYQPSKDVPPDCYDTGDGFYDRNKQSIYDHDDLSRIIRGPSSSERKWIRENCRAADQRMHIGPRPDFYEKFVEPTVLLESYVKPAVKYTGKPQLSPFEEDNDLSWQSGMDQNYMSDTRRSKLKDTMGLQSSSQALLNYRNIRRSSAML